MLFCSGGGGGKMIELRTCPNEHLTRAITPIDTTAITLLPLCPKYANEGAPSLP